MGAHIPYLRGLALAVLGLVAGASAAGTCTGTRWLEDPSISLEALRANGYRVVARHTVTSGDDELVVETIAVRGQRMAKCRTVQGLDGRVLETACFLPCRDPVGARRD